MSASRLRYTKNEKAELAELAQAEQKLRELIVDPSTLPAQVLVGRRELGKIGQRQKEIEQTARNRQRANREKRDNKSEAADIPRRSAKPRDPSEAQRMQEFLDHVDEPPCPICFKERYCAMPDYGRISDGAENLPTVEYYTRHPECAPWNFVGRRCPKHESTS